MGRPITPLKDRFEEKVQRQPGCWIWQGNVDKDGYGLIREGGSAGSRRAHRVAYELFYGVSPKGRVVMHTCDNRICVNPSHLRLGTIKDNNDDRIAKGRSARGEQGTAKLKEKDVWAIRGCVAQGELTYEAIAAQFGVTPSLVCAIKRGRVWSWLQ